MSTPTTPTPGPEPDLRALEQRVAVLEGLTSGRDERLSEGVERLTVETSGLNALLTRVDDQQQTLADLQRRTTSSEARASEVEHTVQTFRKHVVSRVLTFSLLITAALLVGAGIFYAYAAQRAEQTLRVCTERNQGALLIQEYAKAQVDAIQSDPGRAPEVQAKEINALRTLGRFFPVVDCNGPTNRDPR